MGWVIGAFALGVVFGWVVCAIVSAGKDDYYD